MRYTRADLVNIINSQGSVLFNGTVYTNPADLPTQAEIDKIYGDADFSFDDSGIIASQDATKAEVTNVKNRLPSALDADGGFKVHVQNSSGGGGGGAATIADGADVAQGTTTDADTANTVIGRLKRLITEITSRLPAALGGNGGVKVDVVSSVAVSNFPATQPVSAAALPLPSGAATSANQATTNTNLSTISGQLPTALSSGALKVDIVGNTAGVGGSAAPAPVSLRTGDTVTLDGNNEYMSAVISGRGYKGIRIRFYKQTSSGAGRLRFYPKLADGSYGSAGSQAIQSVAGASGSAQYWDWVIYPGVTEDNTNLYSNRTSQALPDQFKICIFNTVGGSFQSYLDYQLLP